MDAITWLQENAAGVMTAVAAVIAAASAITALTPTPVDDNWVKKIKKVLNVFALNVFSAKPEDKTKK
jgi:hypothetical protein